jgi:hypothetical protein
MSGNLETILFFRFFFMILVLNVFVLQAVPVGPHHYAAPRTGTNNPKVEELGWPWVTLDC